MKRNLIRNIIAIATLLLIGLVITQVSWVKNAYELEQKQFSYNVTQALLTTLDNLQKAEGDSSIIYDPIEQEEDNFFVVKMHYTSDPYLLQSLLETAFKLSSIQEDFIFNIYDCFSDSVVYCNKKTITPSKRKNRIPNVSWDKNEGHYFSVFFPGHSNGLFYQMEFWIYSSIILIVIIAFFGFIISQLLKQRRVNEMKTDFINNMTHEFKTPISTIAISVDAMQKSRVYENPDRIKKYAQIIQSENKRLQEQVERILQAATIEKEKVSIKNQTLNLHDLIQKSVATFEVNISSKNGVIRAHFDAKNAMIQGDPEHLTILFNNLIDNAIKYSPDNIEITISTKNVDNKIEITVADQGVGIASEHQSNIFDKFYRVPTGNVHDVKGFGIGLNYVHLIVTKHKGSIKLASKLGKGTSFILSFNTK